MYLFTELISHKKFHKGVWLSTPGTSWYFFLNSERKYSIPRNSDFYLTLDKFIEPIVFLFHKNNIVTTPSCSGHFYSSDYYSLLYDSLINNKKLINSTGINLIDYETSNKFYYRDIFYDLPWSRDEFLDNIIIYQKMGVVGFLDKDKKILNSLYSNDYGLYHDDGITLILTSCENNNDCKELWFLIYKKLCDFFNNNLNY